MKPFLLVCLWFSLGQGEGLKSQSLIETLTTDVGSRTEDLNNGTSLPS